MALIDSKFRDSGDSNSFKVRFPDPLTNVSAFRVEWTRIPYSFYNVRSLINNRLDFSDSGGVYNVQVTPGQYGITDLVATLELAMNATTLSAFVYTVTYDPITLKVTFASTGAFQLQFGVVTSTIEALLGFPSVNVVGAPGTPEVGPNAANVLADTACVLIKSTRLHPQRNLRVRQAQSSVMAMIPICDNPGDILCHADELDAFYAISSRRGTDEYDFKLEYPSGEAVDLNGQDWCMRLRFDFEKLMHKSRPGPTSFRS